MSIRRQTMYDVYCDRHGAERPGCEVALDHPGRGWFTRDDAITAAREAGWFVRENGAVVRCPNCAPKKKVAR